MAGPLRRAVQHVGEYINIKMLLWSNRAEASEKRENKERGAALDLLSTTSPLLVSAAACSNASSQADLLQYSSVDLMALSLLLPAALFASAVLAETADPAFVPPPAHYNEALSWRGLTTNGKVQGYGVSGHS